MRNAYISVELDTGENVVLSGSFTPLCTEAWGEGGTRLKMDVQIRVTNLVLITPLVL